MERRDRERCLAPELRNPFRKEEREDKEEALVEPERAREAEGRAREELIVMAATTRGLEERERERERVRRIRGWRL